jgi:hypothetical protein
MKHDSEEDWERFVRTGRIEDYLAYRQTKQREWRQKSHKPL